MTCLSLFILSPLPPSQVPFLCLPCSDLSNPPNWTRTICCSTTAHKARNSMENHSITQPTGCFLTTAENMSNSQVILPSISHRTDCSDSGSFWVRSPLGQPAAATHRTNSLSHSHSTKPIFKSFKCVLADSYDK